MSDTPIFITIEGRPMPMPRQRSVSVAGKTWTYKPDNAKNYLRRGQGVAKYVMLGCAPITDPVAVEIRANMPVPASFIGKRLTAALNGLILPKGRPDIDNIGKMALDIINGIVVQDDAQVVDLKISKVYSDIPGGFMTIEVRRITEAA